jgi:non-ribosomal peptide synthase protein (TIGR01720 family)
MNAVRSAGAQSRGVEELALAVARRLGRSLETLTEEELLAQLEILLGENGETDEDEAADPVALLEAQAHCNPLAPALGEASASAGSPAVLTYGELNAGANRLAQHLRRCGVVPGTVVGVSTPSLLERAAALIALLKLGAVYLPLSSNDPTQHQQRLLRLAGAACVVAATRQGVVGLGVEWIDLPPKASWMGPEPGANPGVTLGPELPAYIVDVSGRALAVERRALAQAVGWLQARVAMSPSDRFLGTASPAVDVALWELLWPLTQGAFCLLVDARRAVLGDLFDVVTRQRITVARVNPSGLRGLADGAAGAAVGDWGTLRNVICSGGGLTRGLVQDFHARPGAVLRYVYAPPGAGGGVSERTCESASSTSLTPLGRACGRRTLYALNDRLQPAPVGVFAELCVGGEPLGRGYLNDEAATRRHFVSDPFGGASDEGRLFRTGDRGRRLQDGSFELASRGDRQLWKDDRCVEPDWIAERLRALPGVAECVVLAVELAGGETELVAHVASRAECSEDVLREHARQCLPIEFLPARLVLCSELPKTRNGLVDERALRQERRSERVITPPRTALEQQLVDLWRQVLRLDHVGVTEKFFDLGGDSGAAMQLMAVASRAGVRLTPEAVFRHPTIAELAQLDLDRCLVNAEQGQVRGIAPLTPAQRFFFSHELPAPHHFNHAYSFEARQPIALTRLERALHAVVAQHDALRARFVWGEGGWAQSLAEYETNALTEWMDLSTLPAASRAAAFEARATALQASLNLERGPLVRALIGYHGTERRAQVLIILHHLVVDGLSWGIVLDDLQAAYGQLDRGESIALPPKTTSFKYWAERMTTYAKTVRSDALEYWMTRSWPRELRVPPDLGGANREGAADNVSVGFGRRDTERLLTRVTQAFGVSITEAMLAALARSIGSRIASRHVVVEVSHHGRRDLFDEVDLARTVGWFSTLYPVLLELGDDPDPVSELRTIAAQLRAIPEHGFDFFVSRFMAEDPDTIARLAAIPRPTILLNYWGPFGSTRNELLELVGSSVGPIHHPSGTRMYELVYNQVIVDGELALGLTYGTEMHQRATVERLAESYFDALRALVRAADASSRGSDDV